MPAVGASAKAAAESGRFGIGACVGSSIMSGLVASTITALLLWRSPTASQHASLRQAGPGDASGSSDVNNEPWLTQCNVGTSAGPSSRWFASCGKQVDGGLPFMVFTHDPAFEVISKAIAQTGAFDDDEYLVLADALNYYRTRGEAITFVDIGANIGLFSMLAASMGHNVVAFEPARTNALKLNASIRVNGFTDRVQLLQMGLGDSRQVLSLGLNPDSPVVSSDGLMFRPNQSWSQYTDWGKLSVESVLVDTLDAVTSSSEYSLRFDMTTRARIVKMDVEGFEPLVLAGAHNFFAQARPDLVLFEVNLPQLHRVGQYTAAHVLDFFRGQQYDVQLCSPGLLQEDRSKAVHPDELDNAIIARGLVNVCARRHERR